MVLFQRNLYFPWIQRATTFSRDVQPTFFQGVQMLISIETHMTCDFLGVCVWGGGFRAPIPPLDSRMNSTEDNYIYRLAMNIADSIEGAQWLGGRVLDSRPKTADSSLTGVTALWSLGKTHLS